MYLKRPPHEHPESRLDRLLLRKAREGVRIYVVLYKEFATSLSNNSMHSKVRRSFLGRGGL